MRAKCYASTTTAAPRPIIRSLIDPLSGRRSTRWGIRNSVGLVIHPETGELWATDNGPQGGDEINIIKAGRHYGWPFVTYGRAYNYDLKGERSGLAPPSVQPPTSAPGMEEPFLYYMPSIAIAGIAFYTGDKFPLWKGNIFVGGLKGTQLSRIALKQTRFGKPSRYAARRARAADSRCETRARRPLVSHDR